MQFTPYLIFNGQCKEAFTFYEQCLGGKIVAMQTHEETPSGENVPAEWQEWQDRIMHARLQVGDAVLMGSDSPPEYFEEAKGIHVSLQVDDPLDAERIFQAFAEGGAVQMPVQETFWATRFGMVTDRFGTPWMINCEKAA